MTPHHVARVQAQGVGIIGFAPLNQRGQCPVKQALAVVSHGDLPMQHTFARMSAGRQGWPAVDVQCLQCCPRGLDVGGVCHKMHQPWLLALTKELWIEREDFMEVPSKGYFRLTPEGMVRLRYGYVVKCTGCEKDAQGNVTVVHCEYLPDTKSGTPGSDSVKVKGNIHWVSAQHAYKCEVRLYDRLFKEAHPGEGDRDF